MLRPVCAASISIMISCRTCCNATTCSKQVQIDATKRHDLCKSIHQPCLILHFTFTSCNLAFAVAMPLYEVHASHFALPSKSSPPFSAHIGRSVVFSPFPACICSLRPSSNNSGCLVSLQLIMFRASETAGGKIPVKAIKLVWLHSRPAGLRYDPPVELLIFLSQLLIFLVIIRLHKTSRCSVR